MATTSIVTTNNNPAASWLNNCPNKSDSSGATLIPTSNPVLLQCWNEEVRDKVVGTRKAIYAADERFSEEAIKGLVEDVYDPDSLHFLEGMGKGKRAGACCRGLIRLTLPGNDGRLPFQDIHTSWNAEITNSAEVGRFLVDPDSRFTRTSVRLLTAVFREAMERKIEKVYINVVDVGSGPMPDAIEEHFGFQFTGHKAPVTVHKCSGVLMVLNGGDDLSATYQKLSRMVHRS